MMLRKNMILLPAAAAILFLTAFRLPPVKENALTGDWIGDYTWECMKGGSDTVRLSLNDNEGVITGTITVFEETFQLKGYRLDNAELGVWKYEKGQLSATGKQILLRVLDPKNPKNVINTFSGELSNDVIEGIVMNGKECSSFEGPSGHFSIKKIHI